MEDLPDPEFIFFDVVEALRWCFRHSVTVEFEKLDDLTTNMRLTVPLGGEEVFYYARKVEHTDCPYAFREACEDLSQGGKWE